MADPVVEQRVSALSDVSVSDIAQRYKMQEELGSGAQATVYRATHKKTNAKVRLPARVKTLWVSARCATGCCESPREQGARR